MRGTGRVAFSPSSEATGLPEVGGAEGDGTHIPWWPQYANKTRGSYHAGGGVWTFWHTFKKFEIAKTLRNGLSMSEKDPLDHKRLDFEI